MDVLVWLRSLGLERYEAAFRDNEINERVLPSLTLEDLKEIGVGPVGHRRMLLEAIAALRADPGGNPPSADVAKIVHKRLDRSGRRAPARVITEEGGREGDRNRTQAKRDAVRTRAFRMNLLERKPVVSQIGHGKNVSSASRRRAQ
jgi:hypothetical protein